MLDNQNIIIKGAREHNLKNIDIEIPRNKLVLITGLSGSGKSSLAFDTIYAEGQRRYVESLSAYARQFLGLMEKPDVDNIQGLSPAVSIEQKTTSKNPRSTVGTITEIYDYLRLLYARIGDIHCYSCGKKMDKQTVQEIVDTVLKNKKGTKFQILSPLVRGKKGEHKELISRALKEGYIRARVNGKVLDLESNIQLDPKKKHNIEVIVDRLIISKDIQGRLTDSIQTALSLADGLVIVDFPNDKEILFSENMNCPDCNISYEEISPRLFSFNSPYGACPDCGGIGSNLTMDPELVVPDITKSINEGAIAAWGKPTGNWFGSILRGVAEHYNIDMNTPWSKIPKKVQKAFLYGTGKQKISFLYENESLKGEMLRTFEGVISNNERLYKQTNSEMRRRWIEGFMSKSPCSTCNGARLKKEALSILINKKNINEISNLDIQECNDFFNNLKLTGSKKKIANQILKELGERLDFLINVGVQYLTLSRNSGTLSGGEAQRIRLATQIGSQLVGVLYILDEPSIGLHQRDNKKLIDALIHLKDLGNTVIVVEHDKEMMENSDHIIDIGPGAGKNGGYICAEGTLEEIKNNKHSLTGKYLSNSLTIPIPLQRRNGNNSFIELIGATGNNLQDVDIKILLGTLTCITGVSGSGKSTLINQTLYPLIAKKLNNSRLQPLSYKSISGLKHIDKIINIDQSAIGRTPRSNPATYTKIFDIIRTLFAELPESKIRGYLPGRFSFNVKGGRCEACEGDGVKRIEMHFLPDVYVTCEVCKGKRYNRDTLDVKYKNKSISDILDMTVEEAFDFFKKIPNAKRKLNTLRDVGLGYIHLGQQATTLSGGEAQRIKLAAELSKRSTGRTVYILDEPTTGLHFEDVNMLLKVLNSLVDKGNTVIVIEHNLDVIKTADYIFDIGPEGGSGGGKVIAKGKPEQIAKVKKSFTGQFLKLELK